VLDIVLLQIFGPADVIEIAKASPGCEFATIALLMMLPVLVLSFHVVLLPVNSMAACPSKLGPDDESSRIREILLSLVP
jgi:hypothetical protein